MLAEKWINREGYGNKGDQMHQIIMYQIIMLLILAILELNMCFIDNKNMQANIFSLQAYDSVMCWYFRIAFIDFILKEKGLTNFTNIFSKSNSFKN